MKLKRKYVYNKNSFFTGPKYHVSLICVKNYEHRHDRAKRFYILIHGINTQLTAS